MYKSLFVLSLSVLVESIPINNGVIGEPEIECGIGSITVNVNTQNPFEGHVYVKGLYTDSSCRNDGDGLPLASIRIPFNTCNVQRTRSLNPRGMSLSAVVVVTFHPLFLTKIDRAYRVQCFYMEADKTVSQEIEVSMITTQLQTQTVPMPLCRYEILEDGPQGTAIQYALIGQQVYHKWTCLSEAVDTFCMYVHSCYVDDGNGDRVDLLDPLGCAQDKYLLNNPEYPTDLMGGIEAHVFKYADRQQLFFQCQIAISVKEPNTDCVRPQCPAPGGQGAGGGRRRGSRRNQRSAIPVGITDVIAEMRSIDMDDQLKTLPLQLSHRAPPSVLYHPRSEDQNGVCLSIPISAIFVIYSLLVMGAIFMGMFVKRQK